MVRRGLNELINRCQGFRVGVQPFYKDPGPFVYLDLSLGYESPKDGWSVYAYFDNLTDVRSQQHQSIWNGTVGQYGRYARSAPCLRVLRL